VLAGLAGCRASCQIGGERNRTPVAVWQQQAGQDECTEMVLGRAVRCLDSSCGRSSIYPSVQRIKLPCHAPREANAAGQREYVANRVSKNSAGSK
jgi:hypothetical protein